MPQDTGNRYRWRIYEKILLGFASALGWAPIAWVVFMVIFMFLSAMIPRSFPLMEVLFCSHVIFFGILAYFFPRVYILPAWILNILSFFLGVLKIATFLIFADDPDKFYSFESGESRYHIFLPQDVYLTVLELFFLIALYRPALFYFRKFIGRFFWWNKRKI